MKKLTILLAAFLIAFSVSAQNEWTTVGNDIFTTNLGMTVIKSRPGYVGGTRLAIVPPPDNGVGTRVTIGEPNLSSGGFTSLNLEISDYQNGYGSIQVIKSAGSAYGILALNPTAGSVGIGTTTPGSFKLAVEGKIGAREIQVTLQNPWPDYVFNQSYKRLSLASLDSFITKNKHLPNIPSAQEVKEKGGVDLGEMNTKLLEKIEELTLYMIELNKKVEQLEKENKDMRNRN